MPLAILIIGLGMLLSGLRDTQRELGALVAGDFVGDDNFGRYLAGLMLVGSVGFIKPLRPISDGFLLLIILQIMLGSKGGFEQITKALTPGGATIIPLADYRKQTQ